VSFKKLLCDLKRRYILQQPARYVYLLGAGGGVSFLLSKLGESVLQKNTDLVQFRKFTLLHKTAFILLLNKILIFIMLATHIEFICVVFILPLTCVNHIPFHVPGIEYILEATFCQGVIYF
jgi:hypothetical protein